MDRHEEHAVDGAAGVTGNDLVPGAEFGGVPGVMGSRTIGRLAAALARAQGAMRAAAKDSTNPHFRSRYADLASVWDAARAALADNGLAVLQPVLSDGGTVRVTSIVTHASGEWIGAVLSFGVAQATPQAIGSAITYGRRYGLASLLGIVSDDDDDGNAASAPPERVDRRTGEVLDGPPDREPQRRAEPAPARSARSSAPAKPKDPEPPVGLITDAQRRRMYAIAKEHAWSDEGFKAFLESRGFTSSKAVKVEVYDDICRALAEPVPF